jgi:transcriptional regulator with PAS, ATPase and Fis domain
MVLQVSALRDRREDIPLLVQYFLTHYSRAMKKPGVRIMPRALDDLMTYLWPGNVRELENEIQRLVAVLPAGAAIEVADLSSRLRAVAHAHSPVPVTRTLPDRIAELEQTAIREAMTQAKGNVTHAAALLGLSRRGLQFKPKHYPLEVDAAP